MRYYIAFSIKLFIIIACVTRVDSVTNKRTINAYNAQLRAVDPLTNILSENDLLDWKGIPITSLLDKSASGTYSSYTVGELAIYYINNNHLQQAKILLEDIISVAVTHRGRIPRRYLERGEAWGSFATNGDASVISIALSKYLLATKDQNNSFRRDVENANIMIQGWLNGKDEVIFKDYKAVTLPYSLINNGEFCFMTDNYPKSKANWRNSISVENEVRRAISIWHFGKKSKAKKLLNKIIDATWKPDKKSFSSGIDPETNLGTNEFARDAFSLLVIAADGMGILNDERRKIFVTAALSKPDFSSPEGFGYNRDDGQGFTSIPEYMYMDVLALRILKQEKLANSLLIKTDELTEEINGGYSTEYSEFPSAITFTMKANALDSLKHNYYF